MMVVIFFYKLCDALRRETLVLHLLKLFKRMYIFLVIKCVLYLEQAVIVLQESEKYLILWVLNRVISDVQILQVLVLSLGQRICNSTQSFAVDIAVAQNQRFDGFILINHFT